MPQALTGLVVTDNHFITSSTEMRLTFGHLHKLVNCIAAAEGSRQLLKPNTKKILNFFLKILILDYCLGSWALSCSLTVTPQGLICFLLFTV